MSIPRSLNLKQILSDNSYNIRHRTTCDMSCIYCLFTNIPIAKVALLRVVYPRDPTVLISAHWQESEQTACMEESINKSQWPHAFTISPEDKSCQTLSDPVPLGNVITFSETSMPKSLVCMQKNLCLHIYTLPFFSIITPVFDPSWSFRNHSMLICCSIYISYY